MPVTKNAFKSALKEDRVLVGCWLAMAEPYLAEVSANAGFDWVVVDGEHAPNDIRSIRDQLMVIDPSPSAAVVRLPVGEDWLIKMALDVGARNLLIPMVESAEQARALVRATRYPRKVFAALVPRWRGPRNLPGSLSMRRPRMPRYACWFRWKHLKVSMPWTKY